jgi:hypothetical protein
MLDQAYWKKVWLERWLPNIPPAIFALLATGVFAPMVHQYFIERQNMNNARFAFYNRFIDNFGELRGSVRAIKLACANSKSSQLEHLNEKIQKTFESFVYGSFAIKDFFGNESEQKVIELLKWVTTTTFTCENAHKNDHILHEYERQLWKQMSPKVFGESTVIFWKNN